jgi:hypothetical protein
MENIVLLRVRYSETDQKGAFNCSSALEWSGCGRAGLLCHDSARADAGRVSSREMFSSRDEQPSNQPETVN